MASTVTREDLARMYPRAIPAWLDTFLRIGPSLAAHYQFERMHWVHFCGQIDAETDGLSLKKMQESMNFKTAARILEVYSYRLGVALNKEPSLKRKFGTREGLARYLIGKPKELADIVYGGREGTPWMQGSKYLGRGPTQVTHLNNYKAVMEEIRNQPGGTECPDLIETPDVLSTDPELGIRSAFADWHIKGLSRWAECDDCDTLSDALNTGNIRDNVKPHGLDRRRSGTRRAKSIWQDEMTFEPIEVADEKPAPSLPAPVLPVTAADLVGVSRKITLLSRIKQLFAWTGIGGGGAYSLAEISGQGKEYIHVVSDLVEDNAVVLVIAGLVVGFIIAHVLEHLVVEDHNSGRYTPSGGG